MSYIRATQYYNISYTGAKYVSYYKCHWHRLRAYKEGPRYLYDSASTLLSPYMALPFRDRVGTGTESSVEATT